MGPARRRGAQHTLRLRPQVFACASNKTYSARAGIKMCSEDLVQTNLPQSAVAAGWETEVRT